MSDDELEAARARNRDAMRRRYAEGYRQPSPRDPKKERCYMLRHKYGITSSEYDEMLLRQGGVCAICREACVSGRALAVDHCHETKSVRGLLCGRCNIGIGQFRDDRNLLGEAIRYLNGCSA